MKRFGMAILGLMLVVSIAYPVEFTKVGTVGAQFLKIGVDPRGVGMGGAYSAVVNDVTSLYWNPAGIAFVESQELIFSRVEWFADITNQFLGYVVPSGKWGSFGIGITALTMGKEDITTLSEPEGTGEQWGATSISAALSYGKRLTEQFAFGMNVKYIQESIWNMTSNGIAFDFGAFLHPGIWRSLRAGFVITNFGPDIQFHGGQLMENLIREDWEINQGPAEVELQASSYSLPLCLKAGIAYDVIDDPTNKLIIACDFSHPNDGDEKVHIGTEYTWKNMLSLRGGYKYDRDILGETNGEKDRLNNSVNMAFGCGFNIGIGPRNYRVDYAGEDKGRLGLQHRFAFGLEF